MRLRVRFRCTLLSVSIVFASPSQASDIDARWIRAVANDQPGVLATLLEIGDSSDELVSLRTATGKSALMVACKRGDKPLAERLLDAGADLHATTASGGTALMFAVLGKQPGIARWLHALGADIDASGSNGWSALMIASAKGYTALLNWLLSEGADANRADVYGLTPLMRAIVNRHDLAVARLTAVDGIDVNAADEAGNTALHHAASQNDPIAVKRLLELGADTQVRNSKGQTPVQVSASEQLHAMLLGALAR